MNWTKFGIDISKVVGGKTYCPRCHDSRKHHRDRSLSVDLSTGLFNCHNAGCGFKGSANVKEKEYTKPQGRLQKVGERVLKWFNGRKISNNTLLRFKVTESTEWMPQYEKEVPVICFNYFRNDELVNIKFRGPEKSFKMISGAELIFYNIDSIKDSLEATICEGEGDTMAFYEAGIYPVVSVPNGASLGNARLEYLDNCWSDFEGKEKIILATDNDEPGRALREELARRLGKERCYTVDFGEYKDANEVLIKEGPEKLKEIYEKALPWPLEGIITMDSMFNTIVDYYENGYPKGATTNIMGVTDFGLPASLNDYITFAPGQLTMVTGIPGHGKDEFMNLLLSQFTLLHKWPVTVVGLEEPPQFHVTKMIEKYSGKSFMFRKNPEYRVSEEDFNYGIGMVDAYISYIDADVTGASLENILSKATEIVKKKGSKVLVLNPWNCFEHQKPDGMSETDYVGKELDRIISFARKTGSHVFLIAHPTKIKKSDGKKYDVPTLYSINGSANFFNKCHNGMVVYRDYETNRVYIYIQKIKWSWLGQLGCITFSYNTETRQYSI